MNMDEPARGKPPGIIHTFLNKDDEMISYVWPSPHAGKFRVQIRSGPDEDGHEFILEPTYTEFPNEAAAIAFAKKNVGNPHRELSARIVARYLKHVDAGSPEEYEREGKVAFEKLIKLFNALWSAQYETHEAIDRAIKFGNLDPKKKKKLYEDALERIYEAGTISSSFYKYMEAIGKASKL